MLLLVREARHNILSPAKRGAEMERGKISGKNQARQGGSAFPHVAGQAVGVQPRVLLRLLFRLNPYQLNIIAERIARR